MDSLIRAYREAHPELAVNTLRVRGSVLALVADTVPLSSATAADLERFLSRAGWSAQTRHSYRSHIIAFYRWLHRTGQRADNPAADLRSYRVPRRQPRPLAADAVTMLISRAGPRGNLRTALLLGAYAGLRCCEIAAVSTNDIVEGTLYITGKGGVRASVPLHPALRADLARYDGFVFPGDHDGHAGAHTVGLRIKKHMDACGVNATPHQLRHTFATAVYQNTRDLRLTQELMRHSSPATTAVYTLIPNQERQAAVAALSFA